MKLPYIDTFDHEEPAVVSAMCNRTSRVFENIDITSPIYVDQRIAYTQIILTGAVLKKYKAVLMECKQSAKDLAGDKWTLGKFKELYTEELWNWEKSDRIVYDGYA